MLHCTAHVFPKAAAEGVEVLRIVELHNHKAGLLHEPNRARIAFSLATRFE
jgi:hypothetical protein